VDGPLTTLPPVTAASWPAAREAGQLLSALGAAVTYPAGPRPALVSGDVEVVADPADAATDWAESGAMALTGRAAGEPMPCVGRPASRARGAALALELLTGGKVAVDGAALLAERAAFTGLTRGGDVSVGGAARLLRTADASTPNLRVGTALSSLILFGCIYAVVFSFGTLFIFRLLRAGPSSSAPAEAPNPKRPLALAGRPLLAE